FTPANAPNTNVKVGLRPGSIVAADFNGDGVPDLAVASDSLQILLGVGDGTFREARPVAGYFDSPEHLAVADLNGDGVPDLVVVGDVGTGIQRISVLLGQGDGTFSVKQSLAPLEGQMSGLVTGDFNNDGVPDV